MPLVPNGPLGRRRPSAANAGAILTPFEEPPPRAVTPWGGKMGAGGAVGRQSLPAITVCLWDAIGGARRPPAAGVSPGELREPLARRGAEMRPGGGEEDRG